MDPHHQRRTHRLLIVGLASMVALTAFQSQRAREPQPTGSRRPPDTPHARLATRPLPPAPAPAIDDAPPVAASRAPLKLTTLGHGAQQLAVIADELLVRPRTGVPDSALQRLAARLGSRIRGHGLRSGLIRLELPTGQTLQSFAGLLRQLPEVLEALPHAVAVGTGCPSGDYRAKLWNLDRIQESAACSSYASAMPAVVVAVLDTGAAYEARSDSTGTCQQSPDLSGVDFLPGYDFVNDDPWPDDDNQHGTHITAIIAAEGKVVGAAPGVKILPVKVLDQNRIGTELDIVEGLYYAVDHGADVINMSLSFGIGYFPSSSLQDAITYAVQHGVVLVASTGNASAWGVGYPAAFPDVIAVGASRISKSDTTGQLVNYHAPYSNRGHRVDLLAPGGLNNTDFNNDNWPDSVLAQTFTEEQPDHPGYWFISGTSQAAAHVSSAAAWLLADGVLPEDVRATLQASANGMSLTQIDPYIGAGQLQLQSARDLAGSGGITDPAPYYVNILPSLRRGANGGVQGVARLEVIDAQGNRAAGVMVGGSWLGSWTAGDAAATTDANGVATLTTPEISSSSGVALGFRVDRVAASGQRLSSKVYQFYSLSPASAELYSQLLLDPTAQQSLLLFKLEPGDAALDGLVDRATLLTSYVMKPVGAGLRSGPLAVVFDGAFAPELDQPAAGTATPQTWSWPAPLYSGRGSVSGWNGMRIDATAANLGAASHYLIVPLDPASPRLDLDHCYPVLNAYATSFLSENQAFGNGFAASSMGNGFAASSFGNGFASSSLGDGFAASSFGNGFAASSMGNGFAASSFGNGFAASSFGNGFASSSPGNGFAASSFGNGDASTEAVGMGGLLGGLTTTLTTTTSSLLCTVTTLLPALGAIDLGSLNSCTYYIRSEKELEQTMGFSHYPPN